MIGRITGGKAFIRGVQHGKARPRSASVWPTITVGLFLLVSVQISRASPSISTPLVSVEGRSALFHIQSTDIEGISAAAVSFWTSGGNVIQRTFTYDPQPKSIKETYSISIEPVLKLYFQGMQAPQIYFYKWIITNTKGEKAESPVGYFWSKTAGDTNWSVAERNHFLVIYTNESGVDTEQIATRIVGPAADGVYDQVMTDFGYNRIGSKIPIYFINAYDSLQTPAYVELPGDIITMTFNPFQMPAGGSALEGSLLGKYRGTLAHELSHIVLKDISGNRLQELPYWFSEGLATWGQDQLESTSDDSGEASASRTYAEILVRDEARNDTVILDQVKTPSPEGSRIVSSYMAGGQFLEYLSSSYGRAAFISFLGEIGRLARSGASNDIFSSSFATVYKKSFDEIKTEWQGGLKKRLLALGSRTAVPVTSVQEVDRNVVSSYFGALFPPIPPVWSPDGKKIAYGRQEGTGFYLTLADLPGRGITKVSDIPYALVWDWSSDGKEILYSSLGQPQKTGLYDFGAEGSASTQLTNSAVAGAKFVSGQRDRAVFYGDDNELRIYLLDRTANETRQLVSMRGAQMAPMPSPDGKLLAFLNIDRALGTCSFHVGSISGKDFALIKDVPYVSTALPKGNIAWSPDSRRIAFAVPGPNGTASIAVATFDEGKWSVADILKNSSMNRDVAWLANGNWIAFSSDRRGKYDIYLVKPDGSSLTLLTDDVYDDLVPVPSNDVSRIAYYSYDQGYWKLNVMSIDKDITGLK